MLIDLHLFTLQQAATGKARMTDEAFANSLAAVINNAGTSGYNTVLSGTTLVTLKRKTKVFADVLIAEIN